MRYPFPWREFAGLTADLAARRDRSAVDDSASLWRRPGLSSHMLCTDHIPQHGPVVIASNHYQRRGAWIIWGASLITLAVANERHGQGPAWLVTGELQLDQTHNRGPIIPGSESLLNRVSEVYGFISLPVLDRFRRARAIRKLLSVLDAGGVVALFPEGLRGTGGSLQEPEAGFDGLVRHLARREVPIVPVAIYEEGLALCLRFGCRLDGVSDGDDVMEAIRILLPPSDGADGSLG